MKLAGFDRSALDELHRLPSLDAAGYASRRELLSGARQVFSIRTAHGCAHERREQLGPAGSQVCGIDLAEKMSHE
jgi:hypothetical protein